MQTTDRCRTILSFTSNIHKALEFHPDLLHHKTKVPGLSCGVVFMIRRLSMLVQYWLVTDG